VGQYHLGGSGFWISRLGLDDIKDCYRPAYFVTAQHVIAKIQRDGSGGRMRLPLNTKQNGHTWYEG
jgi:hypothetical protein